MSRNDWPDRGRPQSAPQTEALTAEDRRRSQRVRLDLETAVPVLLRTREGSSQWGLARNVSEGGMLIEVKEPPPIGTTLEIKILGVIGSADAPDAVVVHAEVRHNLSWNFGGTDRASLSAIGVRFVPAPAAELAVQPGRLH